MTCIFIACPSVKTQNRFYLNFYHKRGECARGEKSAAPADADNYGIGRTDLFASAAVDAIGRPVRQALALRHFKTLDRTGVYAIPAPRAFVPFHYGYKHPLSP